MGFLDNVKGALRDAVTSQASKDEAARQETARDEAARQEAARDEAARDEAARQQAYEAKLETYTVRVGDSLPEIGARFGVSHLEIARLNSIENPDLIFPGQVFRIPMA